MRALRGLLVRKIGITGIFWCVPLLFFPSSWFVVLGVPVVEPLLFLRLLGAAYMALLVGYYMGLEEIEKGESPVVVIHMGIVSNGFAGLILAYFGVTGAWLAWGAGAQVFMWLSMTGALYITVNLMRFGLRYGVLGEVRSSD